MKELALISGLLSGAVGVISALAFLKGSTPMPPGMETWKEDSEPEKAFRANAKWWNRIGQIGLLLAFALSAASTVASYYS